MRAFFTLVRRELGGHFLSLTGYVIIATVLLLLGFSFIDILAKVNGVPLDNPFTEVFYVTLYFWIILLLTTPVITMRTFALEKFSGTFETLMTAPVGDLQVVLAKFSAAMFFYMIMWLPLLGCIFVVRYFTSDAAAFDSAVVASTFLGILLIGGLFVSAGCCASAITRSQAIAAMISLAFGAGLFMLGVLAGQLPSDSASWPTHVLSSFAIFDQMHDFARGVIDTRSVVLFVSATLFFLFLNLRILESRRWR